MTVPEQSTGVFRHGRVGRAKEGIIRLLWFACAIFSVAVILFILAFLLIDGFPIFVQAGFLEILTGTVWNPTGTPPLYGILPLIAGTLLVMAGAMAMAVPLGIGSAIYIAELAPARVKAIAKPAIELLAGIPSVVYGFFGLIVLTDWIRVTFGVPSGESWLAGSLLLGIMSLPTIISVSEDAITSVPREFREGSLALGATRWQTISRVVVPSAVSGITAAVILGMGRAIGETMAVLMVTGNAAIIPDPLWNVLSPVRTLTGTLGIEMGEVAIGSAHYHALFGVAVVLLVITLLVNLAATFILARIRQQNAPNVLSCRTEGALPKERSSLSSRLEPLRPYVLIAIVALLGLPIAGVPGYFGVALMGYCLWRLKARVTPKIAQKVAFTLLLASTLAVIAILAIILSDIIINGLPGLTWEFLTEPPRNLGRAGGIFPALVGTLYLVAGAIAIALPLGIGAAIYLTEYTREGRLTRTIRTGTDLLNGTPSIVFGLFGFAFLVLSLGFGVSLIAGQVTLALMVLPTIIRTTEESLKNVPLALREGSFALGATRWQTISRVVIPPAIPGIITGAILSIGRAAGETAPILFTAAVFSQRFLPSSLFEPVMALPYHLYILATNVPGADTNKYATALVLLILVVLIYSVAILIRTKSQKN
ncbi:MAG: phosphate transporter permease subunit PtsA [Methanoregulaceae archaeon PtaU1.Bin059]|nr:MAG: phosphate transporter permease subunit PtsA [Methanoregulaceae archaeon PtaB.Bin152]OPY36597.1 MAG: phosphate transporter permease subunit PtsA [Methanoregulaceae archaeon PtaU1.Bin059]